MKPTNEHVINTWWAGPLYPVVVDSLSSLHVNLFCFLRSLAICEINLVFDQHYLLMCKHLAVSRDPVFLLTYVEV